MFEFGKDLRRLFEKVDASDDLCWMEGTSASLLENEARNQSLDSGRLSCPEPYQSSIRACLLWREHARRTGNPQSLLRSESEARAASRLAQGEDQTARARLELAQSSLLAFDLTGGMERLAAIEALLQTLPAPRRPHLASTLKAMQARISARRAALDDRPEALMTACDELEKAVEGLKTLHRQSHIELKIEQAALSLKIGFMTRDLKRLDKAGHDLRALVETSPSLHKPITRGRALCLCGMGMLALASLAKDGTARQQGLTLMQAATDQFPMDHSPLDWAAIQLMRAEAEDSLSLLTVVQIETLTQPYGLMMGAEACELHLALEVRDAEQAGDLHALKQLETCILSRLRGTVTKLEPLDWVANQIGLARIALARARLTRRPAAHLGLILFEAAEIAREKGAVALAARAKALLTPPQTAP